MTDARIVDVATALSGFDVLACNASFRTYAVQSGRLVGWGYTVLGELLHHLALPGEVSWRADEEPEAARALPPERLCLWRQDDNGNRVEMRRFQSRLAAECARRTYDARGHKQLYSIERTVERTRDE